MILCSLLQTSRRERANTFLLEQILPAAAFRWLARRSLAADCRFDDFPIGGIILALALWIRLRVKQAIDRKEAPHAERKKNRRYFDADAGCFQTRWSYRSQRHRCNHRLLLGRGCAWFFSARHPWPRNGHGNR